MRAKLLALVILASLAVLIPAAAFGQQTQVDVYQAGQKVRSVVFIVGQKEYFVNGQTPGIKMDAAPYIDQGRTFVPIRYLAYGLGVAPKDVGWEERARKVTLKLEDKTAELVVGSKTMKAGGQPKAMDVAPQLKTGRTYLPARWVAEALGYQVEWIPDGELVVCWPKGEPRPEADIAAVKKYVKDEVKPVGDGVPKNALRVTSLEQFKFGVEPAGWSSADAWNHKVYQAEVTAADLPQPCAELGNVYRIEIGRAKFTQYDQSAIKVTVDNHIGPWLIIVANGGKDVRYQQVDTSVRTSDGRWALNFCANTLGEKLDGKPLLRPEDVDYFGLDTVGYPGNDVDVLLWIRNPYKNGG